MTISNNESLKSYQKRKKLEERVELLEKENEELKWRIELLTRENSSLKKNIMEDEISFSSLSLPFSPQNILRVRRIFDGEEMILTEKEGKWKIPGSNRLYTLDEIKDDYEII